MALVLSNRQDEAKMAYMAQMLWNLNCQLFLLAGGEEFKFPRYLDLFMKQPTEQTEPTDTRTSAEIIDSIKAKIKERIAER